MVPSDPACVAHLLARALAVAPLALSFRERIVQATGLGALGRYADAAAALSAARALVATQPNRSRSPSVTLGSWPVAVICRAHAPPWNVRYPARTGRVPGRCGPAWRACW